ncbi:hypothetical protein E1B28_008389 [Marasmius oreades]|uniref:Uncharacterized protein n=1 Tax=Marasmius oreades TaxID=181124 RepID=A0A9P7RZ00_9AGAR|nr:uncharacterized protein E1B28_008389 [Marasmius oreades]KAG7092002.1 hypothetical protein E1B28_008389 [Marasmius oreades]
MAGYGAELEAQHGNDSDESAESLDSPTIYNRKRELEERRKQIKEKELETRRGGEVGNRAGSNLEEWSMRDMKILRRPSSSSRSLRVQTDGSEVDHRIEDDGPSTPRSVFEDDEDDDYIVNEDDSVFEEEDSIEQEEEAASSGHTSLWDDSQRNHDTIVFLGQRTKIESTKSNLEFVEEDMQGCSFFADDQDDIDEDYEETARLAYVVDREDDTLHSLYDVYSDIGSEAEMILWTTLNRFLMIPIDPTLQLESPLADTL